MHQGFGGRGVWYEDPMVVKKGVKKLFSHKFEEKKPNEDEARWGNVQGDR